MAKILYMLSIIAAVTVVVSTGPRAATSNDLASVGGLPCNADRTTNPPCPGTCTATYATYYSGSAILCAFYNAQPGQCNATGCTAQYQQMQCGGCG